MAQIKYYVAFSHCLGIGPMKFQELVSYFGSPEKAYLAEKKELQSVLGLALTEKLINHRAKFEADSMMDNLLKKNIQVLTLDMSEYPELLRQISDPPICLYLIGDKNIFKNHAGMFFSIVGTRKVTDYGSQVTKLFASGLSDYGFVIVSGMALGIDALAHRAAIDTGGQTVAVLGCGVDIIYPKENEKLYQQIIDTGGAIISEFPPGMFVQPGFFVSRNRIVSGVSRGVLVVEGAQKSGTLITARYAAEQGRDVYAPPSPITSPLSQAPNLLLKQGAKLVTTVEDIIDDYNIKIKPASKNSLTAGLNDRQRAIIEVIINEPYSIDELAVKLSLNVMLLSNELTILELQGSIAKNQQGKYYIII